MKRKISPLRQHRVSVNVNMLVDIKKITQNIVLSTYIKYCTLTNKSKFYFSLEKGEKKFLITNRKKIRSFFLQKADFGRICLKFSNDELLISSKSFKKIIAFVKKQLHFMIKKCYLIDEIVSYATNHFLSIENIVSKQKIQQILVDTFFNSEELIDRFFKKYLYLILTRRILCYTPFEYV